LIIIGNGVSSNVWLVLYGRHISTTIQMPRLVLYGCWPPLVMNTRGSVNYFILDWFIILYFNLLDFILVCFVLFYFILFYFLDTNCGHWKPILNLSRSLILQLIFLSAYLLINLSSYQLILQLLQSGHENDRRSVPAAGRHGRSEERSGKPRPLFAHDSARAGMYCPQWWWCCFQCCRCPAQVQHLLLCKYIIRI
jgi:hypothetical protein